MGGRPPASELPDRSSGAGSPLPARGGSLPRGLWRVAGRCPGLLVAGKERCYLLPMVRAVVRARWAILSVALTFVLSILAGVLMVEAGSPFALGQRDAIVGKARAGPIARSVARGQPLAAALLDFVGNATLGCLPKALAGISVVVAYPLIAHQGWVGGIVSVRADHTTRLDNPKTVAYYLLTLLLQVAGYTLAVGGGVNMGLSMLRRGSRYSGPRLLGLVTFSALADAGKLYALALPLLLAGSLWEFLSRWNI